MTNPQDKPERKWQMIRLKAGDYLLPSNDRATVFRIYRYTDGPSGGLDMPKDRDFWAAWRWLKDPEGLDEIAFDYFPDGWTEVATFLDTRQEAIDAALRWEAKQ